MANIERLQKMIKVLRNFPKAQEKIFNKNQINITGFDLNDWGECGSAACAGGMAAVHPWFNKQGLTTAGTSSFCPAYEDKTAYDALAEFFDLSLDRTLKFFDPEYYNLPAAKITPEVVANRIEKYVLHKQYEDV